MSKKYLAKKYQRDWAPDVFRSGSADPEDTIYLNIGDPDIITPKVVLDAAFADGYAGHTKYTDTRGYPELRAEICRFYKERYGMDIKDSNVCVVTSGQFGMYVTCQACLDQGDEVLIIEPYFMPYADAVEMAGGVPVLVSTLFSEGFQINIDRLEKAVTPRTKALIINIPTIRQERHIRSKLLSGWRISQRDMISWYLQMIYIPPSTTQRNSFR